MSRLGIIDNMIIESNDVQTGAKSRYSSMIDNNQGRNTGDFLLSDSGSTTRFKIVEVNKNSVVYMTDESIESLERDRRVTIYLDIKKLKSLL